MSAEILAVEPPASRTSRAGRLAPPNPLQLALRRGIGAALKAEGDRFVRVKAKTVLGQVVQGLVNDAQRGKVTAIRLMVSLFAEAEPSHGDKTGTEAPSGLAQGLTQENRGPDGSEIEPEDPMQWDWTEAGEWIFADSEEPRIPPDRQSAYAAEARRMEEVQRVLHEKVDRFFEQTSELRARLEAEPPGSALRTAQWRVSAEALRASDSFGEPLRTKLVRIADNELAEEERLGRLQASGDPCFQAVAEEERARRNRWPKIVWITFLGFGTRLHNADVDTTVGEDSQEVITTTEAPDSS